MIRSNKIRNAARGEWHIARIDRCAITCTCAECGAEYKKRQDRVRNPDFCALACRNSYYAKKRALELGRNCDECSIFFVPRYNQVRSGQGRYCSNACAHKYVVKTAHTEAANKKRGDTIVKAITEGGRDVPSGERHSQWKGGPAATIARRIKSGKSAESLRRYRKDNPDFVRNCQARRRNAKGGRLERGTVKRIGDLQKWKCVICKACIKASYHTDHIMPLALGGKHEPHNIQLLCPTCNVRKSAKHPTQYMQERGFLI